MVNAQTFYFQFKSLYLVVPVGYFLRLVGNSQLPLPKQVLIVCYFSLQGLDLGDVGTFVLDVAVSIGVDDLVEIGLLPG